MKGVDMEPTLSLTTRIAGAWAVAGSLPVAAAKMSSDVLPAELVKAGTFACEHPAIYASLIGAGIGGSMYVARKALAAWYNGVRPWLAQGKKRATGAHQFDLEALDLVDEVRALTRSKPAKKTKTAEPKRYFVGRGPRRAGWPFGTRSGQVVTLTDKQRTMHVHCMGQTGSGKSASVLLPLVLQDALAGKAIIVMDAKGSEENLNAITNIAAATGRLADLRVFSLPFPERSNTYNPFWIEPRSGANPKGGDPLALSERVFSVFKQEMAEPFYRNTNEAFFRNAIRVLHGLNDKQGRSVAMNASDVLSFVQDRAVLDICLPQTTDRDAADDIDAQLKLLGPMGHQSFAGLQNLVQAYTTSPILNAYAPDIVLAEVLERKQIVYFQLPANFYGQLTQSIGKIVLQELQQAGARRQIDRSLDQSPVGVFIDEFYNFAYPAFIESLNKLRDSNLQFFLAHQSLSDLERISKEYAAGIWDNTRTKIVLYQNNAQLCEQIAKSIGTYQTTKTTMRQSVGELAVKIDMGEQSVREVEEFRLHPNAIKGLAPVGQAYLIESNQHTPMNLAPLPARFFEKWQNIVPPKRKPDASGLNLRAFGRQLALERQAQAGAK
ncbi:MAG: type IV secretory system conjugative DNA transfer family protein [Deltaproteobacteria bacterium]|nr:type IV secretory system conjugative DNA transfer family protein [Deltaproteobacteria bacterium]